VEAAGGVGGVSAMGLDVAAEIEVREVAFEEETTAAAAAGDEGTAAGSAVGDKVD
jgi:hypothetical protein